MKLPRKPSRSQKSGVRAPARRGQREFNVLVERDSEGWYIASVPELRGCHTQAKSLDVLMTRVREAIQVCLEATKGESGPEFIGVQRIAV